MRISSGALAFAVVGLGLLLTGVPAMAAGETESMQGAQTPGMSSGQAGSMGTEGAQTTTHKKHHRHHSSRHHHKSHNTASKGGAGMSNGSGMNSGATETTPGTMPTK